MLASLIICTRNRAAQLETCLEYVRRLETPEGGWELILVDNGSTDATPAVTQGFAVGAPCRVIVAREPQPGLARARNAGLAHATGDLFVFTDDDCYVRPDFLVRMSQVFSEFDVGYAGGRVLLHDPTDAPITILEGQSPESIEARRFMPPGIIIGANMAFTRALLKDIGGFDPIFDSRRVCDDIDFLSRACWAGWRGRYDPRPTVAHHHGRKPGADVARLLSQYQRGRGAYYMKRVLDAESRAAYLWAWQRTLRDYLGRGDLRGPLNVFTGTFSYLLARLRSRDTIPRF